jgi:hypothetical protein
MSFLASIPNWFLRFVGARPAAGGSEVWFGFEGMDPGWALLLAGMAALVIARVYYTGPGRLTKGQRIGLAALRSATVVLLLIMLTHPVLRVSEETTTRGALLVLQDTSASMDLRDTRQSALDLERVQLAYGETAVAGANPDPSRSELIQAVAANQTLNLWPRVSEKVDVIVSTFGRAAAEFRILNPAGENISSVEAASFFSELPASAPATAIADSLNDAFEMAAGRPLTGVLLITDGVNNAGAPLPTAIDVAQRRGLPLYVYATGVEAPCDLGVLSFSGPAMAFAREEAVLNVRLRSTGLEGESTEVLLKTEDTVLDRQTVQIEEDGEIELSFNYTTTVAGEFDLTVEATSLYGEATAENNAANMRLRVLDRRVKVLLIEQEPRWDFRYLLDTLKRDRRIEVDAVMLDGDATLGRDEESRFLKSLPTPRELLDYVIVVIGDVDPARLSPAHMEALDTLARQTGGGLVFHAGPDFNPLSYKGSVLEDLLPVGLPATVVQSAVRYEKPVSLLLTAVGRRSPLLRLDPNAAESESLWRGFPGVRWTAKTGPAKPGAEVLLIDPSASKKVGAQAQPVLARMSVGRGQVFYFGFDETWRWRSQVGERDYLKIWGQVFLKLGVERLTGASDLVQLNTVRSSYALGETVLISGRIFQEDFQPLEVAEVAGRLTIEPTAETQVDAISQVITLKARAGRPGDYEMDVLAATPGRYSVRTDLDPDAVVVFSVSASNLEMRDPALNLAGLMQLVGESGQLFREEDLDQLPQLIGDSLPITREVQKYEPAFHPLFYCLLLLLPTLEWMLRRILKLK